MGKGLAALALPTPWGGAGDGMGLEEPPGETCLGTGKGELSSRWRSHPLLPGAKSWEQRLQQHNPEQDLWRSSALFY